MIINNKRRKIYLLLALPLSIFVAYIFTTIAPLFKQHTAPAALTIFVELLCGLFFAVAIGMIFNEDSRINGVIYAGIFAAIPVFYVMLSPWANITLLVASFSAGVLTGLVFVAKSVLTNRYDNLAKMAKVLFTAFFAVIIGFLAYEIYASSADTEAAVSSAYAAQNIFFYGAGIVISLILYVLALKLTVGVRASEIFIFGPRSSGKTYFVLGLWGYISEHFDKGHSNEGVVLTGDPNDEGDELRISNLYASILDGKILSRTYRYQMVMYQLTGKKYGIIPVKWTVVDYAGEYYDELNEINFRKAVSLLSEKLDMTPAEVRKHAGTIKFVKYIKLHHSEKLLDPEFTKSVIISTMYGNFLKAGKVIFLIDGEKITDNRKGHSQLAREFGGYMKTLIDLEERKFFGFFSPNKKYALAVTKTDLLFWKNREIRELAKSMNAEKLSDIPERSRKAEAIEKGLFDILSSNMVFKNLVNIMNDISMYFVAVSVDATAEPFPEEEGMEDEISPSTLAPWRFTEIFRFGL
ncbi:FtsH-binding integral membrane protein [Methanomicrobium sp. W14]|uniref:US12 family protein n=1 Tax=Methanomicrobium sp. W14 TaxID=2817839 RepID=UPI001AE13F84|nr:US12 family protein [Methanomicrobium sp. W14]MBP2133409.1 FtsH-binding integral membrane protein [Methanomicrobium sp. W14]